MMDNRHKKMQVVRAIQPLAGPHICSKLALNSRSVSARIECVPEASRNRSTSSGKSPLNQAFSIVEETMIIRLTEEQVRAVAASGDTPPTLVDPNTQTTYVLIRKDLYERLTYEEYDDSPWTAEERDALAWEAGKHAGWDDMDEYDDDLERP